MPASSFWACPRFSRLELRLNNQWFSKVAVWLVIAMVLFTVFKQFDTDRSVARFTPHAAFDHPHTPADAPLRESIEARILVLF